MIALAAAIGATALTCTVDTERGIAGLVREKGVKVTLDIGPDRFAGTGHPDLSRLKEIHIGERGKGRLLVLADYEDLPSTHFEAHIARLDTSKPEIEWVVIDLSGRKGEQTLAGRAVGVCSLQDAVE